MKATPYDLIAEANDVNTTHDRRKEIVAEMLGRQFAPYVLRFFLWSHAELDEVLAATSGDDHGGEE